MYTSLFELFKIGIGPSSSHTVGPINASNLFIDYIKKSKYKIVSINIEIYGSLALTGKGHGTDLGIIAGLLNIKPKNADYNTILESISKIKNDKKIFIPRIKASIAFDLDKHLHFKYQSLKSHKYSNAILYKAETSNGDKIEKLYYSIGGGFILDEDTKEGNTKQLSIYDFNSANALLDECDKQGLTIGELIFSNELKLKISSSSFSSVKSSKILREYMLHVKIIELQQP